MRPCSSWRQPRFPYTSPRAGSAISSPRGVTRFWRVTAHEASRTVLLPRQPPVDPLEELGVTSFDPAQALDDDPEVERHHKRDQRLEGDLEPKLAVRRRKRLGQHRSPFLVDACEARAQRLVVPGERLELEPRLLVRDVLRDEV